MLNINGVFLRFEILENSVILTGNFDCKLQKKELKALSNAIKFAKNIDMKDVKSIDFTFAMFVLSINPLINIKNPSKETLEVLKIAKNSISLYALNSPPKTRKNPLILFELIGKGVAKFYDSFVGFVNFFGTVIYYLFLTLINPARLRFNSLLHHINNQGFKAMPVGLLTSFIVAAAISLQGAIQLNQLGAPLMSIDTTAKLALREMGPFILATVIAGRSASSFTAQLGVMRLTEEIDAMKVMGFNIYDFLVVPRFLALVIAMPLLVFLSDAVSLLACAIMIRVQLGVSFVEYVNHFYQTVSINHFYVGMAKAPFFGAAIALVGCYRGLQVRGDTESIGRFTTISVVNALFWIISINALFSFITTSLNY